MRLLQDGLFEAAERHADLISFESEKGDITFKQFFMRSQHLAGALQSLGLKKKERVAILSRNCFDYIAYHYATAMIGAIFLPLNIRHTNREMLWILNNSESSILIIDEYLQHHLPALISGCPTIRFTISLGVVPKANYVTDDLANGNLRIKRSEEFSEKDSILLIYTSGTTGRPKGAVQTHEGLTTIDRLTAEEMRLTTEDVYFAYMPFFHQAGIIRTRATLIRGGKNVIVAKVDIDKLVSCIIEKGITVTMLVPPLDHLLIEAVDKKNLDLSSLRIIIGMGGGGPKWSKRMQQFCGRFKCQYRGLYGQTETSGPVAYIMGDDCFAHPYSCGKAREGIDLAIWDENKNPVPPGVKGEIMVRGKTTIPGYWKNDDATKRLYTGQWLHTGDMGKLDDEGYLYFLDRQKDLVKTGGENVYPKEVEDVLVKHPSISNVAVIGLPDPEGWGEVVAAVVVLKPGCDLSLDELKAFCKNKIAGYKIPKAIHFLDKIPKNFTDKVDKLKIRKMFGAKE